MSERNKRKVYTGRVVSDKMDKTIRFWSKHTKSILLRQTCEVLQEVQSS